MTQLNGILGAVCAYGFWIRYESEYKLKLVLKRKNVAGFRER